MFIYCIETECDPGRFRSDSMICEPCVRGQYQPERNQESCIECGNDLTTMKIGSNKQEQCVRT